MAISFTCDCGKQLRTRDEAAGKRVKCPACGGIHSVPQPHPSIQDTGIDLSESSPWIWDSLINDRVSSAPPPLPKAEWYYSKNDQRHGKITVQSLKQLIESGQVSSADLAWKQGMPEWQIIGSIPELKPSCTPFETLTLPPTTSRSSSNTRLTLVLSILLLVGIAGLAFMITRDQRAEQRSEVEARKMEPGNNPTQDISSLKQIVSVEEYEKKVRQHALADAEQHAKQIFDGASELLNGYTITTAKSIRVKNPAGLEQFGIPRSQDIDVDLKFKLKLTGFRWLAVESEMYGANKLKGSFIIEYTLESLNGANPGSITSMRPKVVECVYNVGYAYPEYALSKDLGEGAWEALDSVINGCGMRREANQPPITDAKGVSIFFLKLPDLGG